MAEKQEDKYSHIKKYEKRAKIADDMVDMTDKAHRDAFSAYESHFVSDEGRGIDLEKAKDAGLRNKAIDSMIDVYIDKAKNFFKAKDDADEFDESLMLKAYAGTTRQEIKQIAAEQKENFNFQTFQQLYRNRFMKDVEDTLKGAARSHLDESHIDDIVKYTKIDKEGVDSSKLRYNEAMQYLDAYRKQGSIPPKSISQEHKKPEIVKKEKKDIKQKIEDEEKAKKKAA